MKADGELKRCMNRGLSMGCGVLLVLAGGLRGEGESVLPGAVGREGAVSADAEGKEGKEGKPDEGGVEDKPDAVAAAYLTRCSGCHTLTDVKLTGPGLAVSSKWPEVQLKAAIKRMEDKVGPLADADVDALAAFVKDAAAPQRLAAEQEKMQARFLAKLAPPDAVVGRDLFTGAKGFANGGMACAACHAVSGAGGNLGPDLTGLYGKMGGKPPIVSAIEKSNFKLMEPHYRRHPVTTQEALHLAEYFAGIDPAAPVVRAPYYAQAGAAIAAVLLAGMTLILRAARARQGRDTKLVRRR